MEWYGFAFIVFKVTVASEVALPLRFQALFEVPVRLIIIIPD